LDNNIPNMQKMPKELDSYDRKIMHELDIDSRSSAMQISRKVRLPKETVLYRIRRLQQKKYVRSFYAVVNGSLIGFRYYKVYVRFQRLTEQFERSLIGYLKVQPSCLNLRINEGPYDLTFITMHEHITHLRDFLHRFNTKFGDHLLERSVAIIVCAHKFSLPVFSKQCSHTLIDTSRVSSIGLDAIDRKIINLIAADGRQSIVDMARSLHLDPKVVGNRIRKLRSHGVLAGFCTSWNLMKLENQFVQVDFILKDPELIRSIIQFFEREGVCMFAYEVLGKYDLSLELYVENDRKVRSLMSLFKEHFAEKYISYDISHVHRHYVLSWSPFEGARKTAAGNPSAP
jgi:DNA-binding Lrp family transcriptional regulator